MNSGENLYHHHQRCDGNDDECTVFSGPSLILGESVVMTPLAEIFAMHGLLSLKSNSQMVRKMDNSDPVFLTQVILMFIMKVELSNL